MKEKILAEIEELRKENEGKREACYNNPTAPYTDIKYYSGFFSAFDQIEELVNSLPEEPVSKDICNQCEAHNDKDKCDELVFGHKCPIVTTREDLEEASEEYTGKVLERTNMLIGNQPVGEEIDAAFKAGVQWQKEQFEKNRLKHCNSITNEQAELEQGFIDQHLDKYQRMPTFLDAVEYGMRLQKEQMMKDAVDGWVFRDIKEGNLRISDNKECWNGIRIPEKSIEKSYLFCTTDDAIKVKLVIVKED